MGDMNTEVEATEVQLHIEALLMDKARLTAQVAVFMQALAGKARTGEQEWAKRVMAEADRAALRVRRETLVVARVLETKEGREGA